MITNVGQLIGLLDIQHFISTFVLEIAQRMTGLNGEIRSIVP